MNVTTATRGSFDASISVVAQVLRRLRAGFQGITAGLQAYRVYSNLELMSDAQLKAKGLTRADLPALAMKAIIEADKA